MFRKLSLLVNTSVTHPLLVNACETLMHKLSTERNIRKIGIGDLTSGR
jgi:hypothetical protein